MEMTVVTLRGGRVVPELSLQAGRVAPGRPPAVVQQNLELIWEDDPCAELGCAGCSCAVHSWGESEVEARQGWRLKWQAPRRTCSPVVGERAISGLSPAESRREEQPQKAAPAEAGGDDRGLDRVAAQKGHPRSCIHHAHLGMDLVKR
jgi:hypothetical protein